MDTVLRYVEAGAGIGIATDSVAASLMPAGLRYISVTPTCTVPLVMAWDPEDDSPAVRAFRDLVSEWLGSGQMWELGQENDE
jgi:DNA-binding transcriptional LysR family regulator